MTTKMYEGKIKNIGIFVDQRIGLMRCIELDDENIYILSKDIEKVLGYKKLKGILKRYYYCDKKFLLTNAHVVNFISNNSYRLNPYIIELSKSVLLDISN